MTDTNLITLKVQLVQLLVEQEQYIGIIFAEVNGQIGQSANNQIDCLELIGKELKNEELNLWKMKNGYALINQNGLLTINKKIAEFTELERKV